MTSFQRITDAQHTSTGKSKGSGGEHIQVRPRQMEFSFPEALDRHWYDNNPYITHFVHALSATFPDGERFFIQSVRNYMDQIDDPEMQKNVRGFIGQEAHHGKHHEHFNTLIGKMGYPMDSIIKSVKRQLNFAQKNLPKDQQLAITVALEHFTAILAHQLLTDDRFLEKAPEYVQNLMRWHAIEETEHKAVAFDVYQKVCGDNALRKRVMRRATVIFLARISWFQLRLLWADGLPLKPGKLMDYINYLVGVPGFFRKIIPDYMEFYQDDFHPWQQDNSSLLDAWKERYKGVAAAMLSHE